MQVCDNNTDSRSKVANVSTSIVFDLLCLSLISVAAVLTLVRDFSARLCQIVSDENLAAHCHFFLHPEHFNLDIEFQSWSPIALSSMLNWLPAFICKFTNIEPIIFFQIGVVFQNVGIACGVYLLSRKLFENLSSTNCRIISLLATTFVMFWRPQWYNASLICGLDWVPYANWVALPFLLMGFTLALKRQTVTCALALLMGVLIHPIMGGLAVLITALFYLATVRAQSRLRTVINCFLLLLLTFAVVQIPISISTAGLHFTTDVNRHDILVHNIHATPWLNRYPYGIATFVASLICIFDFSLLALWPSKKAGPSKQGQILISCTIISSIIISILHCIAASAGFNPIHNLILTRATVLLLLVATPTVVAHFWQVLFSGSLLTILPVLTCLFAFNPISLTAAMLASIADMIKNNGNKAWCYWILLIPSLALTLIILTFLMPQLGYLSETQVLKPLLGDYFAQMLAQNRLQFFDWRLYLAANFVILCARLLHTSGKIKVGPYQWIVALTLMPLLIYAGITENRKMGKSDVTKNTTYCQAQLWARDNTPEGSSFILVQTSDSLAWRGLTKRQVINIIPIGQIYKATSIVEEYNKKLSTFWNTHKTIKVDDQTDYKDLNTTDWQQFAREFGGDYIVRVSNWPKLELPMVYKNRDFVIYQIPKPR